MEKKISKGRAGHAERAQEYRSKAAACAEVVKTTRSLKQGSAARKSRRAYTTLAENEDWLADNSDKLA